MTDRRKLNILGVLVDATDYESTLGAIVNAARAHRGLSVSASAVHSIVEAVFDRAHKHRLNHLDLVVPDGQPIRWALNLLYQTDLKERVYGPTLTLAVCEKARQEGLSIFFFGSTQETLLRLRMQLETRFPGLKIAGVEPSQFRRISVAESEHLVSRIHESQASIIFVGLGCPRQEVWAYEFTEKLRRPVIAVGGAFDVLAGVVQQAPMWMQAHGVEWLFRLSKQPRRLWRRYLLLNPVYALLLICQALRLVQFHTAGTVPDESLWYG
jgi:N-acetylglucosaminyldiphosphoundecaprenol N-acetyl-beta-D-mannosaminyltransferase